MRADSDTIVGIFTGKLKAEAAFMQGRILATNLAEMMVLGQVLSFREAMDAIGAKKEAQGPASEPSPEDPVAQTFSRLALGLVEEKAKGKSFNIFFQIKDGEPRSLILKDGRLTVENGKVGTPSCIVRTDADTVVGVFSGKIQPEAAFMQGKFSASNLTDMMTLNQVVSVRKAMQAIKSEATEETTSE